MSTDFVKLTGINYLSWCGGSNEISVFSKWGKFGLKIDSAKTTVDTLKQFIRDILGPSIDAQKLFRNQINTALYHGPIPTEIILDFPSNEFDRWPSL